MRTAVAAGGHSRWQRRPSSIWKILLSAFVLRIERTLLTTNATGVGTKTGSIFAHDHSRDASFTRAEQPCLRPKRVPILIVSRLEMADFAACSTARHFGEAAPSNANVI